MMGHLKWAKMGFPKVVWNGSPEVRWATVGAPEVV